MGRPEIVIIAAVAEKNRVIGKDNELPWYISEDLKRFKRLTIGHPVLMGRKTFESIVARLGKPLPHRRNVVLTKSKYRPAFPEVETYDSLEAALAALADEKRFAIIGGESLFRKALTITDRLELTIVEGDYEGDAFFPAYEHLIDREIRLLTKEEKDGYRFETYERIG
ncbi:dihydrofolate reductase [candidate division KSB1 bacterium]|nr:dihydrofolate reductase [candidate division KSB1 bacterium]